MAKFNPYAKRKRGIVGKSWDLVADNVSMPSAGSLGNAAVRILGGRGAALAQDAHRAAVRKLREAAYLKSEAAKAAKAAGEHAAELTSPVLERAAKNVADLEKRLPEKVAALRRKVVPAARKFLGDRTFESSVQQKASALQKKIAGVQRSLAKHAKVLAESGDPARRLLASAKMSKGHDVLARLTSQLPGMDALTQRASSLVNKSASVFSSAQDALRGAEYELRGSLPAARDTLSAMRQRASDIAGRAANRARVEIMKRAPTLTGFQRATLAGERAVNTAATAVKSGLGGLARRAGGLARQLVPVALKPAPAATAAVGEAIGKAAGKAAGRWTARQIIPRLALAIPTGGASLAIEGAAWGLPKYFNAVERLATKVAGTGAARTLGGKAAVGLLRGASSAGGFALGAWIDAGMKAYDFFSNGGSLSDIGRDGTKTIKVNGRSVTLRDNTPGWTDIIFSRDYAKEVLKGAQSALTLGFTGNGDDTMLDRWFDEGPDAGTGDWQNPNEQLVDVNGNSVFTKEELERQNYALAYQREKSRAAQQFAKAAGTAGEQNVRALVAQAMSERDAALDQVALNSRNWGDFSRDNAMALRGRTLEQYQESATGKADDEFARKMARLLANPDARKVMNANRAALYNLYYGRDYDKDSASGDLGKYEEGFRAFNREWAEKGDVAALTWNRDAAARELDELTAAEYEKLMKQEQQAAQQAAQ